jgi:hypothetical protein
MAFWMRDSMSASIWAWSYISGWLAGVEANKAIWASCRETCVIIANGGLSDEGIALIQGIQHMDSIIKAEFESVADKIRMYRGLLIVVKLTRESR